MKTLLKSAAVLLASCAFAQHATDKQIGVWTLNLDKSELPVTGNPTVRAVQTVEKIGPKTYRETFDRVYKNGEKRHMELVRLRWSRATA